MTTHEFVADESGFCTTCRLPPFQCCGEDQLSLDETVLGDAARASEPRPGRRHRDAGDTERASADDVTPHSGTQRAAVLLELASADGLTDDEIATRTGLYLYSAAPRRNELLNDGLVEDTGERRATGRSGAAIVWRVTDAGRRAADVLTDRRLVDALREELPE